MRQLVYYVASTIDGFIAGPDGSWDFFRLEPDLTEYIRQAYPETIPTAFRATLGIEAPNARFDAVVMGRGTYEPALKEGITSPYTHLRQYVFTRSLPPAPESGVELVSTDPVEFVRQLKVQDGRDIWLCGGGQLAGQLLPEIDEFIIKVNPIISGGGIPIVHRDFNPRRFELIEARSFDSGVLVTRYRKAPADVG